MKVLLTGVNGLIGSRLVQLLEGYELTGADTQDFDITDIEATHNFVKIHRPDVIIHLAAYTNTEKAEVEKDLAWKVNVTGTDNLLRAAAELNKVQFIFFSTDHTFSGEKGDYKEEDEQHPVNYYGETKVEAEKLVAALPNSLVLRISYPFRSQFEQKSDIVRWMLPRLENKEELHLVDDQYVTPTFIDDLAVVMDKAIEYQLAGVYHSAGSSQLSFLEMGQKVAEEFGYDKKLVKGIHLEDFKKNFGRKASLPRNSTMDSSKLRNEIGFSPRPFDEALKIMKEQMK